MSVFFFDYVVGFDVLMSVNDTQYPQFGVFHTKIDTTISVRESTQALADAVACNAGMTGTGHVLYFVFYR